MVTVSQRSRTVVALCVAAFTLATIAVIGWVACGNDSPTVAGSTQAVSAPRLITATCGNGSPCDKGRYDTAATAHSKTSAALPTLPVREARANYQLLGTVVFLLADLFASCVAGTITYLAMRPRRR